MSSTNDTASFEDEVSKIYMITVKFEIKNLFKHWYWKQCYFMPSVTVPHLLSRAVWPSSFNNQKNIGIDLIVHDKEQTLYHFFKGLT